MSLVLDAAHAAAIRRHGEADYPNEACGLMGGRTVGGDGVVTTLVPLANERREARTHRYVIDPAAYLRAQAELDRAGLEILGVYHSHPDHPAEPSEFDREHAWPHWSYVIVAVARGRAEMLRSWRLSEDRTRFAEEPLNVQERKSA